MIKFYRDMVKPLRDELGMTRESFAYTLNCGVSTIRNYEKIPQGRMKASVRDGMIRLMKSNGITTDQLKGETK